MVRLRPDTRGLIGFPKRLFKGVNFRRATSYQSTVNKAKYLGFMPRVILPRSPVGMLSKPADCGVV